MHTFSLSVGYNHAEMCCVCVHACVHACVGVCVTWVTVECCYVAEAVPADIV